MNYGALEFRQSKLFQIKSGSGLDNDLFRICGAGLAAPLACACEICIGPVATSPVIDLQPNQGVEIAIVMVAAFLKLAVQVG